MIKKPWHCGSEVECIFHIEVLGGTYSCCHVINTIIRCCVGVNKPNDPKSEGDQLLKVITLQAENNNDY